MCLIVDANVAAQTFAPVPAPDFRPVWDALSCGQATAVFGGKLAAEYCQLKKHLRIIRELERSGRLHRIADAKVNHVTNQLVQSDACVSDDEHIIALAQVSGVRLLCSHDRDLHMDFTNPKLLSPAGRVYQNPGHAHLIRKYCGGGSTASRRSTHRPRARRRRQQER